MTGDIATPPYALAVWLDGAPGRVGLLSRDISRAGAIHFGYDAAYLRSLQAVPLSASLPLRTDPYGDAAARVFFDNLLPEGERRRTEALTRRIDPSDIVGLLRALGTARALCLCCRWNWRR